MLLCLVLKIFNSVNKIQVMFYLVVKIDTEKFSYLLKYHFLLGLFIIIYYYNKILCLSKKKKNWHI